jgi:NADH-quinone oxidoreductase subunit K
MEPQLSWYLALSAVLFTIGVAGVIMKRNVIAMFMCIELMLNAVNLTFIAFSSFFQDVTGQLFVFIVMTVAAAEAAVGLGIIITIFRNRESLDVDDASILKLSRLVFDLWSLAFLEVLVFLNEQCGERSKDQRPKTKDHY